MRLYENPMNPDDLPVEVEGVVVELVETLEVIVIEDVGVLVYVVLDVVLVVPVVVLDVLEELLLEELPLEEPEEVLTAVI